MKRKGRRSRHGHREGEDGEHEKKAKTAPDICNDVLLSIFSRLTARDAARCAALSKRHRQLVGGVDFWLLHRRLSPPLPRPCIAYMATAGASDPTTKQRRPAPAALLDHVPAAPGYMFFDFHLAGGRPGDDNDELRYSLVNRVHLRHKYVGTCNGVILLAPERFDGGGAPAIVLFNPAIAGSEEAVRMELPDLPEPGRYRVAGFGYGTSRRLHKVLVSREERVVSPNDRKSHRAMYRAKELLVYTLGGPSSPGDGQRLRSVLPELDAKISGKSVYLDGKVYLLADYSRVLVFDVDDETVATVDLPGERLPGKRRRHAKSKLMEFSGSLSVATATTNKLSLWLVTPDDQQWVRLCELRCGDVKAGKLTGAWDCGGVVLLYFIHRYTKVAYLHMYDTRNDEGFSRLSVPRAVAEQGGAGGVLCWGYKPTLVSPGSIVGAPSPRRRCAGGVLAALDLDPQLERDADAGRERTLEVVCFMNLLLYITRKLPDNVADVIRELKRKSLPLSLR